MTEPRPMDEILKALQERAKELNCLYRIDELLHQGGLPFPEVMAGIIRAMPPAWQYPAICRARDSSYARGPAHSWKIMTPFRADLTVSS